jgi:hypothetical protein
MGNIFTYFLLVNNKSQDIFVTCGREKYVPIMTIFSDVRFPWVSFQKSIVEFCCYTILGNGDFINHE